MKEQTNYDYGKIRSDSIDGQNGMVGVRFEE